MTKKPMFRVLCAVLVLTVLVNTGYALSTGDSLISLSFLTERFFPAAVTVGKQQVEKQLNETYDEARQDLDKAQRDLLELAAGEDGLYSATLAPKNWSDGSTVDLPTGSGFLLQEGTAVVTHKGAVVDVAEGTEVPSGSKQ